MNRDALNALDQAVAIARERAGDRPPIVGVAGPQGSGKTTLVKAYAAFHPRTAHFSLDDVYLPASYRRLIAQSVHPAVRHARPAGHAQPHPAQRNPRRADRGEGWRADHPPRLRQGDSTTPSIPATAPSSTASRTSSSSMAGASAPPRRPRPSWPPRSTISKRRRTRTRVWRKEINENLAGAYQLTFGRLDAILHLQAPQLRDHPRLALRAGRGPPRPRSHRNRPPPRRPLRPAFRAHHPPHDVRRPPRRYRGAARRPPQRDGDQARLIWLRDAGPARGLNLTRKGVLPWRMNTSCSTCRPRARPSSR